MVVVVDGYNVMHVVCGNVSPRLVSERERDLFVLQLRTYVRRKSSTIKRLYVVFDGGELRHAERYDHGDVVEVYSGYVESADDWIVQHVTRSGARGYVVVTNDRGLGKRVARAVELVVGAEDFWALVRGSRAEKCAGSANRSSGQLIEYDRDARGAEDVDRIALRGLMEQASRGMLSKKSDDECAVSSRDSKPAASSKESIRVRRIIKKL